MSGNFYNWAGKNYWISKAVVYSFDDSYFSIPAYAVVGLAVGNGDYHSNFAEIVQEKGGDKNGTQFTFLIGKLSRGYCTDIRK